MRCHRQPPECSSEAIRSQTAFDPNVCNPPVLTEEQPLLRASAAYTLFTWPCHSYSNASIWITTRKNDTTGKAFVLYYSLMLQMPPCQIVVIIPDLHIGRYTYVIKMHLDFGTSATSIVRLILNTLTRQLWQRCAARMRDHLLIQISSDFGEKNICKILNASRCVHMTVLSWIHTVYLDSTVTKQIWFSRPLSTLLARYQRMYRAV